MRFLAAVAALIAAALAVPKVRSRAVALLARAGRGTNVHFVPAPDQR